MALFYDSAGAVGVSPLSAKVARDPLDLRD
jgi:hypothetical protein